ncbi:hypothetical protein [Haladaptatus sp. NG-SE-30]
MTTKRQIEKRLNNIEDTHGLQEINLDNSLVMGVGDDIPEDVEQVLLADWRARWRLGDTFGMFIVCQESADDFYRRLQNALDKLEERSGVRIRADDYIAYLAECLSSPETPDPTVYFAGELTSDESDKVWQWTVRQASEYGGSE